MTKDKFLKWCEDNAHKFVIISYQGGAGGVILYANPALDITSNVQERL